MRVVVDSSGWIEYLAGGRRADAFQQVLLGKGDLLVPSLVVFEVYRKIKKTLSEEEAIFAVTQLQRGQVVPLDSELALFAADLSLQHRLSMADSIIYATARAHEALLVTADGDFKGLPNVTFIP